MSTAHIYGDPPDALCDENSALGYGLAPQVGAAWEAACHEEDLPGTRRVLLRTSFVLGREGGALGRLRFLVRLGLGGKVGHGRQGMSWLHEDDFHGICERALTDANMQGMYVVSAPEPVSNRGCWNRCRLHLLKPRINRRSAARMRCFWWRRVSAPGWPSSYAIAFRAYMSSPTTRYRITVRSR